jgi:PiT family inorganic phosphate transporter
VADRADDGDEGGRVAADRRLAAETAAATVIEVATRLGIPISTTHTISSAILGVGATKRLSATRWGVAGRIVSAWVITIPACVALAWAIYRCST